MGDKETEPDHDEPDVYSIAERLDPATRDAWQALLDALGKSPQ